MPFSKFIVFPIFVAFQAALLMLLAPYIKIGPESIGGPGLIAWVTFQAWAMYFLGGCTVKMAGKTAIGYAGGIIASIALAVIVLISQKILKHKEKIKREKFQKVKKARRKK